MSCYVYFTTIKKKNEAYLCSEVPSRKRMTYLRQISLTCKAGMRSGVDHKDQQQGPGPKESTSYRRHLERGREPPPTAVSSLRQPQSGRTRNESPTPFSLLTQISCGAPHGQTHQEGRGHWNCWEGPLGREQGSERRDGKRHLGQRWRAIQGILAWSVMFLQFSRRMCSCTACPAER